MSTSSTDGAESRGLDVAWAAEVMNVDDEMTGISRGFAVTVSTVAADAVARIAPDATLYDVADALAANDVGALVVGEADAVEGVVSERDLARALADRRDPQATRASDVARRTVVWCDATATITEVANVMMEQYVRHVLVEQDGRLTGIVSARDLLGAYAAADAPLDDDI